MKHLGSLESTQEARVLSATPRATLTDLLCSPNFPRASYLDERTLTYEPIVKLRLYLAQLQESLHLIITFVSRTTLAVFSFDCYVCILRNLSLTLI